MSEEQEQKGLSRRSFLKKTSIGIAAVGSGSVLAACAPQQAQPTAAPTDLPPAAPQALNAELAAQKWSFEIPPDPIPDSEIAETVEADIIVVGAGVSGLVVANSAVENGAKVVLIAASAAPVFRGGSFHSARSKHMKEVGLEPPYDVDRFFRTQIAEASYNVDQDKWYKFYNHSEEAMDWLIDKMEAAGFQTVLEKGNVEPNDGPMHTYPGSHSWINDEMRMAGLSAGFVVSVLADNAAAAGVDIRYKVVAKQLVREDNNTGRVTAVIAQGEDGAYTKYVGSKAIILATGDFSADREMMAKYSPWAMPLLNDAGDMGYDNTFKFGGLYKGDGHKMGLWVGAAWQRTFPNPPMIQGKWTGANQPYGSHRGLQVNKNGVRYTNEDINGPFQGVVALRQPEYKAYAIWDSTYAEKAAPWYGFGMIEGSDPIPPSAMVDRWESEVESGALVKADTVEAVIEALGLPLEATKATIDQYNEYCDAGEDLQYHKRPELLVSIKEGPFYGGEIGVPDFLTVMGGLRTNINMQVCDENDEPIPGLYNLGVMIGDYYANFYNFLVAGNNLGACCLTFGYLTGRDIATDAL